MQYKALIILLLILQFTFIKLSAQDDTIFDSYEIDFKEFVANADSLLLLWYKQNASFNENLEIELFSNDTSTTPFFPDDVILTQLRRMNSYIEMTFNPITKQYIEFYSKKRRKLVSYMLGNSEYYFPFFEEALDKYGLPLELKYLPIIESALNPRAVSRAKAVGLWQFILPTAKLYGLKVTSFIDERMDLIKSTDAAARYLRDLYNLFQDWHLVLAAYNCGPANVNKAIKRSGKTTYWGIYKYLPRETRGYVPAFIGAAYTFHYYKELNITPRHTFLPKNIDTVYVTNMLHLRQISELLQIPLELLQILNPVYKKDIIPALPENPLPLYLPIEYIPKFIALKDSVYKYKDSIYFRTIRPSLYASTINANFEEIAISHKVKKGETIQSIAKKYKVSASDIANWNNISQRKPLIPGKTLVIYIIKPKEVKTDSTKKTIANINLTSASDSTILKLQENKPNYHIVRQGDTLYSIAKFYNISLDELCKINNITNSSQIQVGQKILIPQK
jgi:membrane-bound lytic murein transglycosylase D